MARILVVDDDAHIREVLRFALQRSGHEVMEADDGAAALRVWQAGRADLVVLDVLMPEMDGLEVCRRLRHDNDVPILFLSSRDDEVDRILGLELGADDYVTKPFSPRELVARVRCILRRSERTADRARRKDGQFQHGALELDRHRHDCRWEGASVDLTVTEFGLLHSLCGMPGKVYTRDEIVERAWGAGHHITDRTIDSHVRRIRQKFRPMGGDPVETVYGLGYRLRGDARA
jgi:two-component system OmpR family response regulator